MPMTINGPAKLDGIWGLDGVGVSLASDDINTCI